MESSCRVMDSLREAVKERGLTLEHNGVIVHDWSEWRAVVGARYCKGGCKEKGD